MRVERPASFGDLVPHTKDSQGESRCLKGMNPGRCLDQADSPPREEGWLRHQENFGEAHRSAADGVVALTETWLASDHPGRCRRHPPSPGRQNASPNIPPESYH